MCPTQERKKCFKRYFDDADVRREVNIEFANFSGKLGDFADEDSLRDKGKMDAKSCGLFMDLMHQYFKI